MGRRRIDDVYHGAGFSRNSSFDPWTPYTLDFQNLHSINVSRGHRGWRNPGPGDVGGPFQAQSVVYEVSPGTLDNGVWRGPFVVSQPVGGPGPFPDPGYAGVGQMTGLGTTGIARTIPTNPAFSMSTALGELRNDGLPHVIGSTAFRNQVSTAKKAGDEYLNFQFGWKPLVNDLRKFAHSVKNSESIMDQYIRGSDKKIKRSYDYPLEAASNSFQANGYVGGITGLQGTCHVTDTSETRTWFEAAYRYHVPLSVKNKERFPYFFAQARQILGLELTPEVVWNLAPWSWAVDWFGNVGDVMKNISRLGKDGLAMQYGYTMRQEQVSRSVRFSLPSGEGSFYKRTATVKNRYGASPYGFFFGDWELNSFQLSIIAALGLSRGGRAANPNRTGDEYKTYDH